MAYELEDVQTSQEIFYYLLEHRELNEIDEASLFARYAQKEEVQNLVKSQGEIADCDIERYGNVIYMIPREENYFLGYSRAKLRTAMCRSGATNKDYYLSQFVILTLLVEFYDGRGSSAKSRDFIRVGDLQNQISLRLREGAEHSVEEQMEEGFAFTAMLEAYESLKSVEGSRAKTTKEGFLHQILKFLEDQGLVEYIVEDEMVVTTKKLDNFMDWNLLNQNHIDRVRKVFGEGSHE